MITDYAPNITQATYSDVEARESTKPPPPKKKKPHHH
jgi:hypothetical protein